MNGATIIQSGCHGSFVGRLDLELNEGKVFLLQHELISVDDSILEDAPMQWVVERIVALHREMLAKVVGQTETALNRNTFLEATMDNLLLQAIAEAADARIAFSNGWRYGAPIPLGHVTVKDLWNIVPPNPLVSLAEVTGREMWEMMEENLEHTLATDPYQQVGRYVKWCLGVNVYLKIENPLGSRIKQFFTNGEELQTDRGYRVAFITTQAVPKKYGRNRRDLSIRAIDALKHYLRRHSPVNAELKGSLVTV